MSYEAEWKEEPIAREELDRMKGYVVVEFGADWCPHCQAVQPALKRALESNDVPHFKVADGKGKRLGRSFAVKLWPNLILLKDGEIQGQLARPSEEELTELLTFS